MKKEWLVKTLALSVVVLILSSPSILDLQAINNSNINCDESIIELENSEKTNSAYIIFMIVRGIYNYKKLNSIVFPYRNLEIHCEEDRIFVRGYLEGMHTVPFKAWPTKIWLPRFIGICIGNETSGFIFGITKGGDYES